MSKLGTVQTVESVDRQAAIESITQQIAIAVTQGRLADALAVIDKGERDHPDADLPRGATWRTLRTTVSARMASAPKAAPVDAEAPKAESAPKAEPAPKATPVDVQAPAAESAPKAAQLHIVHTVDNGTIITGTAKGDGSREILGRFGQRWSWHRTEQYWFLSNSAGWAADQDRIDCAVAALTAGGLTVDVEIDNHDHESERPAPVKPDSEYRQARLQGCRMHANQVKRDGVQPAVETAPAPARRTRTTAAAPKATAPKAETVSAPVAPPAPARPLESLDVDTIIAMVKAGDADAIVELKVRMCLAPAQTAPVAPSVESASTPEPETTPEPEPETGPLTFVARVADDAKPKQTTSDVRRRLHETVMIASPFRRYSPDVRVHLDKDTGLITVTVTLENAPDSVRERAEKKIRNVTLYQRGVAGEYVAESAAA